MMKFFNKDERCTLGINYGKLNFRSAQSKLQTQNSKIKIFFEWFLIGAFFYRYHHL